MLKLTGICYLIDEDGKLKISKSFVDELGNVSTQIEDAEEAQSIITISETEDKIEKSSWYKFW